MELVSSIDIWKKRLASTKGFTKSKAGTEVPVQSEGRARHEVNNLVDWNCFDELIFLGAKTFTDRVCNSSRFVGPYLSGIRISDWIVRISYLSVEHPLGLCGGSAELAHEFDRFVFSLFGVLVLKGLPKIISLLRGATHWSRTCQEKCELDTVVTKGIIPSNDKLISIKASGLI